MESGHCEDQNENKMFRPLVRQGSSLTEREDQVPCPLVACTVQNFSAYPENQWSVNFSNNKNIQV